MNLAAIMYADLTGAPRPEPRTTRACLDWVHPKDVLAARANGISLAD